ncbi:unnamed protein product [Notodromas monacha]|uniref:ribonuclease H n=1 Tax=Notodromas monacha TaxID=399045 RepID=A0A7R9BZI4_9CRUS|nr:unnamed protein product [Notodromas monacha]CAG0923209.1 unnamed protein product [Notodromas monacha]
MALQIPSRVLEGARRARSNMNSFFRNSNGVVCCYADGSCMEPERNAGVGVWFGPDNVANISEPLPVPGTNNRAELLALLYAIYAAKEAGLQQLVIRSDSQYAINCVTDYLPRWKSNSWRTMGGDDVQNQTEIRAIDGASVGISVKYEWVEGHAGHHGNGEADALAKKAAEQSLRNHQAGY